MKKVDVLFIYETRVRELESVCLLKTEMERRGYTTAILNTWNEIGHKGHKYDAKVVVSPSMYNNGIFDFVKDLSGNVPKLVNLQWEQIGPVGDEDRDDAWYLLKDLAHQCVNICWGDATYDRLVHRAGIDEKHLRKTGQIAMDFCKPEYRGYYMDRDTLFDEYNVPKDKQVNLFISSFSYVDLPSTQQKESLFSEVDNYVEASCKSFDGIVKWFERFLQEFPDQILIYRPHPAEADNARLKKLAEQYPDQFFIITQLSVKQWIATVDRVYTWFSTATAEAYAFGKPVAILRPVKMPDLLETTLLQNANKIETYEDFANTIHHEFEQALSAEDFHRYYRYDDVPAYVRVCDAIEEVLKNDEYLIKDDRPTKKVSVLNKIKSWGRSLVSAIANILPKSIKFLDKYRTQTVQHDEYTLTRQRNNYASEEDIIEMQNKIRQVFFK